MNPDLCEKCGKFMPLPGQKICGRCAQPIETKNSGLEAKVADSTPQNYHNKKPSEIISELIYMMYTQTSNIPHDYEKSLEVLARGKVFVRAPETELKYVPSLRKYNSERRRALDTRKGITSNDLSFYDKILLITDMIIYEPNFNYRMNTALDKQEQTFLLDSMKNMYTYICHNNKRYSRAWKSYYIGTRNKLRSACARIKKYIAEPQKEIARPVEKNLPKDVNYNEVERWNRLDKMRNIDAEMAFRKFQDDAYLRA